jgi:hypothetical protein
MPCHHLHSQLQATQPVLLTLPFAPHLFGMQLLQPVHKLRIARALLGMCSSSHVQLMQQFIPAGIGQRRLGCAAASQCSSSSLLLIMQQLA